MRDYTSYYSPDPEAEPPAKADSVPTPPAGEAAEPPAEPAPPPPAGDAAEPIKEFPRQKRRYRLDTGELDAHNQQITVLSSILASLIERKERAFGATAKEGKIFRFRSRRKSAASSVLEDGSEGAATPGSDVSTPATAGVGDSLGGISFAKISWLKPRSDKSAAGNRRIWFLYGGISILLALIAFIAGRQTAAGTAAPAKAADQNPHPPAPAIAWSDQSLAQLHDVLTADQAGDVEAASKLATTLKGEAGALPGLETYQSLLEARHLRFNDAQVSLDRLTSTAAGASQLAAIDNAVGFTYARQRRFPLASETFKHAAWADPFGAENFRLWGESLRREGRLPEAISEFQEALLRLPAKAVEFAGERAYLEYKIRLSQIENGLDAPFKPTLDEHLAAANPGGYWLLTDAALALQQADNARAAASLKKAQAVFPAAEFNHLLGDYFFRSFASRVEVAAFFPADPEALRRELKSEWVYFIDP